jgi:hypothetical protein
MPADYDAVLKALGKAGRLQEQRRVVYVVPLGFRRLRHRAPGGEQLTAGDAKAATSRASWVRPVIALLRERRAGAQNAAASRARLPVPAGTRAHMHPATNGSNLGAGGKSNP